MSQNGCPQQEVCAAHLDDALDDDACAWVMRMKKQVHLTKEQHDARANRTRLTTWKSWTNASQNHALCSDGDVHAVSGWVEG